LNNKRFTHLNEMQQAAVGCTEGPLLILAGAGSGKTTVLINRIANIIEQGLAQPEEILAITFTNKAANELKDRIERMLGSDASQNIWAHTFHAACVKILRRHINKIGYSRSFNIFDQTDQKALIKACIKDLNFDERRYDIKAVMNTISRAKDKMMMPENFRQEAGYDYRLKQLAKIYDLYQRNLERNNSLDFDDIIMKTVTLFRKFPKVLAEYQDKFKYILVDEYQDTNMAQYILIKQLAGERRNLYVVGDDDQSIYKFRGATIENILNFEKHFGDAKVVKLEQNYRSTQNILNAANSVIKENLDRKGKKLWTANDTGEHIELVCLTNEKEEAKFIAENVGKLVNSGVYTYSDFALLYRMNAQSRNLEEAFIQHNIPYKIVGGLRFYDRKEIKDIVSYLKLIHNKNDNLALKRIINVPSRKIGKTTVEHLEEIAKMANCSLFEVIEKADDFKSLEKAKAKLVGFKDLINSLAYNDEKIADFMEEVIGSTGYIKNLEEEMTLENMARIENMKEFLSIARVYDENAKGGSLGDFLENIMLFSDIDEIKDSGENCVIMMTLHASKGLEFPVVFMTGMEQNIFPSALNMNDAAQMAEERRLCYVGITRAKQKLFLTRAKQRLLFGKTDHNPPSPFIRSIPMELTGIGADLVDIFV